MKCIFCGGDFFDGKHSYDPKAMMGVGLYVCPEVAADTARMVNTKYLRVYTAR